MSHPDVSPVPERLRWPTGELTAALQMLGGEELEARSVRIHAGELEDVLRDAAPIVLSVGAHEIVVLVGISARRARVLSRDGALVTIGRTDLTEALWAPLLRDHALGPFLSRLPSKKRSLAARRLLAREVLGPCWVLRARMDGPLRPLAREHGLAALAAGWLASHATAFGLWVASWILLGRSAFAGAIELSWLVGWALTLATVAPLRVLTIWLQGTLTVRIGALVKRRLMVGSMHIHPDVARERGFGDVLGQVEESTVLERLAIEGTWSTVSSALELVVAAGLLVIADAPAHALLTGIWCLGCGAWALRLLRIRRQEADRRVGQTARLIESLLGRHTRLAQEAPARWHTHEDPSLAAYHEAARRADRTDVLSHAWVIGFVPAAIVALAPAFVAGAVTPSHLVVVVAGTFLVRRSLEILHTGLSDLVDARVAFERVRPILDAARGMPEAPAPEAADLPPPTDVSPVVEARGVAFHYPSSPREVIRPATFQLGRRARVLVEGPSGGGKSTLASLLLGQRAPTAGTLWLDGLDRQAWGPHGWRARISGAPQLHENHVIGGTLAFNLLLGRAWPPSPDDLEDAAQICYELGLGPLLERMPGGLHQLVGSTGWRLSHGERARLFLARALLQPSQVLVLDESFGPLDAQTAEWCLHRTHRFPGAVLVVAHP